MTEIESLKLQIRYLQGEVYILRHFMAGLTSYQTYPPYLSSVALWNYAWFMKAKQELPEDIYSAVSSIPSEVSEKARGALPIAHAIYADVIGTVEIK
jgi:hypothetical protein